MTIDGPHRIFMKQAAAGAVVLPTGERSYQRLGRVSASGGSAGPVLRYREGSVQRDAQREAERVILNRYAPPSVLIGPERQVLHFRGDVDGYLRIQPGRASFDLLKMARDGLQAPLRSALEQSARENGPVRIKEIVVRLPGGERKLELEVVPLSNLRECCRLILFHETGTASPVRAISAEPVGDSAGRVAQLERELADARDYLQSIQEQQEAAQQELEASNEEGQSANEELQSLVEELETSKEELQATNEELTTVNEELGQRLKQVSELNGDLNNLQAATNLAVVLLGPDLVVRRFTPPAKRLFGLHASDVGQPLRLTSLPVAGLKDFVAAACAGVGETTHEMADEQGRWHALRVRPYLNTEGAVDGAVLMMTDIDELKRTEIRIAGEREHAEAIVQAVPSPLVILSAELNLVSANDAFYRTFQLAPAEAVGRNFFAIDNGVWESVRLRKVLRELSSQADFFSTLELGHHFPRLGARTLLIDARVLGVRVDFPREIVLSIQDVTDVLAFQVGLRRSELRYRRLFEAAREGVLLVEPSSRKVIDANSSIAELLDCPGENLKGRELHEIGLLPSRAEADDLFRRLREDGQVRYPSLPLRARAGGSAREVELAGALYREQDDSVVQFHVRDITERKRTARLEAIVREGEQQYRSLFNAIDEGFAVIELQAAAEGAAEDFVFLETNPSFAKQSGLGEVAGRSIRDVAPLLEPRWFSLFSKVAQSGVPVRLEAAAMGIWWDALVFRLGEAGSRQVALLLTDTTDRHAAEVQLREVQRQLADRAGELEKLVTERTAELTSTNKQLEEFVYSIAHDLRAPLRSMQVFSAMLLDEAPNRDAAGREYIERINKSAEFMDALLRDLLAFSKVSQQRVELQTVPLGEAVDLALSTLAEEIRVRHATVDAVGPWPNVQAHQPTVTQVLLNLIGNALKFARPGESPRVRVYAEEHDATVRLCVEDAGIGIAPEHQEQIFRLFTRLHGGKFAGTGVGLSIVQKGIERLGGKVGVKSGAGQGSCFWFELPRVKSNSKDLC